MIPTLQTERLTLRQPAADDWPVFWEFFQSDRSSFLGGPMDLPECWRKFAAELGHWQIFGCGMWAVTRTGEDTILGLVGPWTSPDWPETEVGWMIFDPSIEGTGVAAEAAKASIAHAYEILKWDTVVSYVAPGNDRSARLAEKLGAVPDPKAQTPAKYPDTIVYRHPKVAA